MKSLSETRFKLEMENPGLFGPANVCDILNTVPSVPFAIFYSKFRIFSNIISCKNVITLYQNTKYFHNFKEMK